MITFVLTKAPIILNDFQLIMSISIEQSLFRDSFHWFKNEKKNVFGEKIIFGAILLKSYTDVYELVKVT